MKLFKKATIFGITAVLACGVGVLAACGENGGGGADGVIGQVSDSQWQQYLSVNVEACKNLTFTEKYYNTYSKAEAATYGSWENQTYTCTIDNENEIIHEVRTSERYESATGEFETDTDEEYYFAYKGAYYRWRKDGDSEYDYQTGVTTYKNDVSKITKAEFISQAEDMSNAALSQATAYKMYKNMFTYNKETASYDLMQMGTMAISMQFLEGGGFRTIMKQNSMTTIENIVTDIDKTTVTVPASVKADVDAYIAELNEA